MTNAFFLIYKHSNLKVKKTEKKVLKDWQFAILRYFNNVLSLTGMHNLRPMAEQKFFLIVQGPQRIYFYTYK
jgi:hypothetical protein